jgi:hypothetical protein
MILTLVPSSPAELGEAVVDGTGVPAVSASCPDIGGVVGSDVTLVVVFTFIFTTGISTVNVRASRSSMLTPSI